MITRRNWIGLNCLVFALAVAAAQRTCVAEEPTPRQWKVGEETREALLVIPASAKKPNGAAAPVVFAFHGHGGNMRNAARSFPIHTLWPEAICVYMQGLPTPGQLTDPEGKRNGWQKTLGDQNDRDLKFFDAVLSTLHEEAQVDDQRVFAMGHSNGGAFSYLLMATRADKLAAIAPSASLCAKPGVAYKPKPVMHIGGRNDPLVKFSWQESMIASVKKLNQCETTSTSWAGGAAELFRSPIEMPVVLMLHDGKHAYPKEAPALIVKFFKEYKEL